MKNFYLINSFNLNELNQSQKDFLDKQLTTYHTHSSSVIDKAEAIHALVGQDDFKKLRFEYNAWLFDFVNYQLKTLKTEEENEALEKILASCYYFFGLKDFFEGNTKKALDNYLEALKIREKLNDKIGLFFTYYKIASVYYKKRDFSKTIKFYEKCIDLSGEIEDKTKVAKLYFILSAIFMNRENFAKGLDCQFKALSICEENNDEQGIALCYKNIGLSLIDQLELDEALKYFFAALKISKKLGNKTRQALSYVRIGSIYQKKGENNTALKFYMKAENLPTTFDFPLYVYLKIGTVYESQNQFDLEMGYYNKSLKLSKEKDFKDLLSETLSKIGALEIIMGNIEEAKQHIESAFMLAQELSYPEPIKAVAAAKVLLAIAIEDYKLAYEMEKLRNETQQKILNKENFKEVIKHQLKYEYEKQLEKKDIEIEEEKQNNQHLQEQINILLAKNRLLTSKNKTIIEQVSNQF